MVSSSAEACAACGSDLQRQVKAAWEQAHTWKQEAAELQELLAESESSVRSWQQHALAASKEASEYRDRIQQLESGAAEGSFLAERFNFGSEHEVDAARARISERVESLCLNKTPEQMKQTISTLVFRMAAADADIEQQNTALQDLMREVKRLEEELKSHASEMRTVQVMIVEQEARAESRHASEVGGGSEVSSLIDAVSPTPDAGSPPPMSPDGSSEEPAMVRNSRRATRAAPPPTRAGAPPTSPPSMSPDGSPPEPALVQNAQRATRAVPAPTRAGAQPPSPALLRDKPVQSLAENPNRQLAPTQAAPEETMKSEIMHLRQEVDRLRRDEIARCQAHQVGMAPPQVVSAYHERAMRLESERAAYSQITMLKDQIARMHNRPDPQELTNMERKLATTIQLQRDSEKRYEKAIAVASELQGQVDDLEEKLELSNKKELSTYGPNLEDLNANLKAQVTELEEELSAKTSTPQEDQQPTVAEISLKRERVETILSTFRSGLQALSEAGNSRLSDMNFVLQDQAMQINQLMLNQNFSETLAMQLDECMLLIDRREDEIKERDAIIERLQKSNGGRSGMVPQSAKKGSSMPSWASMTSPVLMASPVLSSTHSPSLLPAHSPLSGQTTGPQPAGAYMFANPYASPFVVQSQLPLNSRKAS